MREYTLEDLARCREQIDEVDRRLLDLLNERTAVVEEIGRIKQVMHYGVSMSRSAKIRCLAMS